MRALTIKQPWASLIMAGVKDVENRGWPVPSTLPQWERCIECGQRWPDDPEALGDWCEGDTRCFAKKPDGPFPFRLGIHAAKRHDVNEFRRARFARRRDDNDRGWITGWWANRDLPYGALLGSVLVTGCHHADDCGTEYDDVTARILAPFCSPWAEPDAFHWTLTDPQPNAEPIPMKGRQGLWTVPEDVAVPA